MIRFPGSLMLLMLAAATAFGELAFDATPTVTKKSHRRNGDPVNVALVGSEQEVCAAMELAGWSKADPLTVRNLAHEVGSIIVRKQYETAPVSALYLFEKKQDLAFEQLAYKSPKKRHHVRFWRSPAHQYGGRPVWFGAATYDVGVGLSRVNGEITHHIAPDIDAERDKVIDDLKAAGMITEEYDIDGIGMTLYGHNGEGDRYYTDGEIAVGVLSENAAATTAAVLSHANPHTTKLRRGFWKFIRNTIFPRRHNPPRSNK